MNKLLLALGCGICFSLQVYGQKRPSATESLATTVDGLLAARLEAVAPGGVVLVAKKGAIAYKKAVGLATVKTATPMQPEMVFRIGSITKQFTAIAILQLVEAGKISLQDSIQQYVADYPHKQSPITIEHLLTHTSGIKDYQAITNRAAERTSYTPQQGVEYFKNEPLEFKPGSKFKYSNSNYYLLGYIVEVVTGQSYASYVQHHLLDKADLQHTAYLTANQIIANMPQGYSRFDKVLELAELQEITTLYAAGGLASTAEDLFKWHQALRAGKLLSKKLLKKAHTPYRLSDGTYSDYGYGWYLRKLDASPTIEHAGSTDGFQADEIYLPDADTYVVTLFNCFEQDMDWTVLTNDIARVATGKPVEATVTVANAILEKYVGEYTFDASHKLLVVFKEGSLFIEDTNPNDRLPQVRVYPKNEHRFYMKEAPVVFDFVYDSQKKLLKIITYVSGRKDADWEKTK
jgi:CubicO group peptidase (beta-lactamase class C family)